MRCRKSLVVWLPLAIALLLALPTVAQAQAVAKGTRKGSMCVRTKPGPIGDDVRASTTQWEPDDTIDDATSIDDAMDDGMDTLTGSLAVGSDYDDVYAVYLFAGETISLSMTADGDMTDFGLYLFGPEATDIYEDAPVAAVDPFYYGGPPSYPLEINYVVVETGYYFINAFTWIDGVDDGGSGDYEVALSMPREATVLDISSARTCGYLLPTAILGRVDGSRGGVASGLAVLYYSFDRYNWVPLEQQTLSAGTYSFRGLDSVVKTYYMVLYQGNAEFGPSANTTTLLSTAALTNVSASRLGTRKYRLSGYLGPRHSRGSYPVRIYLWRRVNGSWKAAGYQNAVASDYGDDSKYSKVYTFPYKGSWRLQAYHADSGHVTTRSDYTFKTVY